VSFVDRLEQRRLEAGTVLCVGIDPRLGKIPPEIGDASDPERALRRFGLEVLDLCAPHAACFKPQIAFFEEHGLAGLRAYAAIVAEARRRGLLVIGDVKRGDMGTTAEAYARAHLRPGSDLEVDAITLNPFLGEDALAPFVEAAAEHGKGLYVLVHTSNPGRRDLQDLPTDGGGRHVFECVADLVARLGAEHVSPATGLSLVGAVVGATGPGEAAALRARLPHTPFLVPGYGAQGATAADAAVNFRADGSGAVVNASRSIHHPPHEPGRWREAVVEAARRAREELHAARSTA
jgi:orotidine-5'-phosphate decarboxylase